MRVEIPQIKRCCFCLPLRRGIITFGYLNLVFAFLTICVEVCLGQCFLQENSFTIYKGVIIYVHAWLPLVLYALEIIFNIILLVGAHLKKPVLLRVFYYYGITSALAAFTSLFFNRFMNSNWMDVLFEITFVFSGFVITCYILILVRAELKKLEEPSQLFMMTEIPLVRTEN